MRAAIAITMLCILSASVAIAAEAEAEKAWDSTVALGATLTRGNSDTLTVNAAATVEKNTEDYLLRFGTEGNYGETEVVVDGSESTETSVQNIKGYAEGRRKFGVPYVSADLSAMHDKLSGIDLRLRAGLGAGAEIVSTEATVVAVGAGGVYMYEEFTAGGEDDSVRLRLNARADQKLSETAKAWAAVEYLPTVDDFGDCLVNAETGLEAQVNSRLSVRVVLQDRYDSEPPADVDENDLSLITSLVYKP